MALKTVRPQVQTNCTGARRSAAIADGTTSGSASRSYASPWIGFWRSAHRRILVRMRPVCAGRSAFFQEAPAYGVGNDIGVYWSALPPTDRSREAGLTGTGHRGCRAG